MIRLAKRRIRYAVGVLACISRALPALVHVRANRELAALAGGLREGCPVRPRQERRPTAIVKPELGRAQDLSQD